MKIIDFDIPSGVFNFSDYIGDTWNFSPQLKLNKEDCSEEAMNKMLNDVLMGIPPDLPPRVSITRTGKTKFVLDFNEELIEKDKQ